MTAMRIEDVRVWALRNPDVGSRPDGDRHGPPPEPEALTVVEITTADGLSGYGTVGGFATGAAEIIRRHFTPLLIGSEASGIEELWERLYASLLRAGPRGTGVMALSGVDIALWDLLGKSLQQPVYRLLGGAAKPQVPVYLSQLRNRGGLDALAAEAARNVEDGFRAVKYFFSLGPADGLDGMRQEIEAVGAIRAALGPDVELMVDAHFKWDLPYAQRMLPRLVEFDLTWLENPLSLDDRAGYERLARMEAIPLADLGARECRHMWVADVPGPNARLYLGLDATVAWIVLPRGSANPLHDANCRYASSGELHLSRFHGNFVSQAKTYLALAVIGERLSPQSYVDAAYRIVTDAAYTTLGRFAVAEGQRIEFGTPATGTFIDLRLVLGTIDPQTTPVIRAVTLAYAVRTGLKRVFEFFVRVADHLPLRDGGRDRQSARDIKRAVIDAAAADGPTSLVSPDGEVLDVIVRDLEAQAQRSEAGRELTWVMPVAATEYRQSAVSGSHNRLAAYRHEQLAAYTHAQLTSL